MSSPTIRLYRPEDRDALYDICMRTGYAGGDARGIYRDQDLLPDVFAAPYVTLEPDLAFVLDDGGRAVGYVLGTSDSERFVRELRDRWLPMVGARHPLPGGEPGTLDAVMTELLHHPERRIVPELADYPAHLHIDLLPSHQGQGHGRALLSTLFAALDQAGAKRVHLVMSTANTAARAFYDRIGFHEIPIDDPGLTFLGRATT
ncbi:GNAT family N-acetyltransferase [Catenulispora sp. NF23]|uniref:GNAT family N-acetyltransferase n=1 Tax=Catenulispora pinistramenti TaxID=2705254 RepID=UPI001BABB564|nr:GNAT family N-acetyltransferase [Catenulispora pinistramenti]MBS2535294.1 GNAT family N-acetyltransferase [Catenulispora pinistramenti]